MILNVNYNLKNIYVLHEKRINGRKTEKVGRREKKRERERDREGERSEAGDNLDVVKVTG